MKNILIRAASGAVYVALIVTSILFGHYWAFPVLCAVFAFIGIIEFQRMVQPDFFGSPRTLFVDLLIGLLLIVMVPIELFWAFSPLALVLMSALAMLVILRMVMQLYSTNPHPVRRLAYSMLSIFYVAMSLVAAELIYFISAPEMLLLIFIMIWLNDTGAFLVGSAVGSHHLFKRLSPKKSWEGFFGGMCFCIAAGYLAKPIAPGVFGATSEWWLVGMGVMVCVMSTWGDLFESMIKRSVGVKDSGNIIPGHGGILDRIDSLLFVAPASLLYLFIYWIAQTFAVVQGA